MGQIIAKTGVVCVAAVLTVAMAVDAPAQQRRTGQVPKPPPCSAGASAKLASYKVEKGTALPAAIPKPLTGKSGDAEKGLEAFVDPGKGNCLACHAIAKVQEKVDRNDAESVKVYGNHGDLGPPLDGVGARYTVAELRMIIVDPGKAFPDADTVKPAYHARKDLNDVSRACRRKVMLSAQAIEDIVAYLEGLK